MVSRLPSICDSCIHFDDEQDQYQLFATQRCNAFPEGIPVEILSGNYDHRDNHPLDNGVTYDLRPGSEPVLEMWYRRYERTLQEDPE